MWRSVQHPGSQRRASRLPSDFRRRHRTRCFFLSMPGLRFALVLSHWGLPSESMLQSIRSMKASWPKEEKCR